MIVSSSAFINHQRQTSTICSNSLSSTSSTTASNDDCVSPYLNNAAITCPLSINPNAPAAVRNEQIANVLQAIIPQFFHCDDDRSDLEVKPLLGGLSNYLFTVSKKDQKHPNPTILIRIHFETETPLRNQKNNSEISLINRKFENKIFAFLSKKKCAPIYYGSFENGRVEEFYNGYRPLSFHEMKEAKFSASIAIEMAKLHNLNVPVEFLFDSDIDTITNDIQENSFLERNGNILKDGQILKRIDDWLHLAKKLMDEKLKTSENYKNHGIDCNNGKNEKNHDDTLSNMIHTIEIQWDWLKEQMFDNSLGDDNDSKAELVEEDEDRDKRNIRKLATQFSRDIVFAHMDCQSLNILTPSKSCENLDDTISNASRSKDNNAINHDGQSNFDNYDDDNNNNDSGVVRLIDFEYASFNRRAIDISNTFLEHCDMNNLKANFETQYPTVQEQNLFLKSYIKSCDHCNLAKYLDLNLLWDDFLDIMRLEVSKHALFSHLEWATWSIVQSLQSDIDFDYVAYAQLRLDGFHIFKGKFSYV